MANLRQCSRCKSTIDISFFGMNRKKEPYKTCDSCRNKNKRAEPLKRSDTDFVDDTLLTTAESSSPPEASDNLVGEDRQFGGKLLYKDLIFHHSLNSLRR